VDEEEKKQLLNEIKRIFQDGYNDLQREIERLKKEFAPGDTEHAKREHVLALGDVRTVVNALEVFKSLVEDRIDCAELDSTEYCELDVQYEYIKELIGIFEDVLYGRSSLIFKKST